MCTTSSFVNMESKLEMSLAFLESLGLNPGYICLANRASLSMSANHGWLNISSRPPLEPSRYIGSFLKQHDMKSTQSLLI